MAQDMTPATGGRMTLPRSRGAVSGVLLVLLGLWAGLAPFVGPYFDVAYTPDHAWHWGAGRGWFEVAPGAVAVAGGLLLLLSRNRLLVSLGAWLAAVAGAWLTVGPVTVTLLTLGEIGAPASTNNRRMALDTLAFFTGTGVLIVFVAAVAIGRLSARTVRDAQAAARRDEQAARAHEPIVDIPLFAPDEARSSEPRPGEPGPGGPHSDHRPLRAPLRTPPPPEQPQEPQPYPTPPPQDRRVQQSAQT